MAKLSVTSNSVKNISNILSNRISTRKTLTSKILTAKTKRIEKDNRQRKQNEISAVSQVLRPKGSQSLALSQTGGSFTQRMLGFIGYVSAGWFLSNAPTWIAGGEQFIGRMSSLRTTFSSFMNNLFRLMSTLGRTASSIYSDISSLKFDRIDDDIFKSMGELNVTFKNMGDNITHMFDVLTQPFTKLPPLGSEGQPGAYPDLQPSDQQSVQSADYWTLVAVTSLEDSDAQGRADVAQSIYNRAAAGVFAGGNNIRNIILAGNGHQYQPVERAVKEFREIRDRETAIRAVMTAEKMSRNSAEKFVDDTSSAINNPTLRRNSASWVGNRTDFVGKGLTPSRSSSTELRRRNPDDNIFGNFVGPASYEYGRKTSQASPIPSQVNPSAQSSPSQNIQGPRKKYIIIPGHAAGAGTPGEKEFVKRLAKNAYDKIKSQNPNADIMYVDLDSRFPDTESGWQSQIKWYEQKENEGYEILEVHMDKKGGVGKGVIRSHNKQSDVANAWIRQGNRAYPMDWRSKPGETSLAGPRRGVDLFELGTMDEKNVDALTAPLVAAVLEAVSSGERRQRTAAQVSSNIPTSQFDPNKRYRKGQVVTAGVSATISSRRGYRDGRIHGGIDVTMPIGTFISCKYPIIIKEQRSDPQGYGYYVDIIVPDLSIRLRLGHLSEFLVKGYPSGYNGLNISWPAGKAFVKSGSSGRSTGPHLHLEATRNSRGVSTGSDDPNFVEPDPYVDVFIYSKNPPSGQVTPASPLTPSIPSLNIQTPSGEASIQSESQSVLENILNSISSAENDGQQIVVINDMEPTSSSQTIVSSGDASVYSSSEFEILNSFIKNKLLLDLNYL